MSLFYMIVGFLTQILEKKCKILIAQDVKIYLEYVNNALVLDFALH